MARVMFPSSRRYIYTVRHESPMTAGGQKWDRVKVMGRVMRLSSPINWPSGFPVFGVWKLWEGPVPRGLSRLFLPGVRSFHGDWLDKLLPGLGRLTG
jgi:hypothetical protein